MLERLAGWFEKRVPLVSTLRADLAKPEPLGIGWWHCFGSSVLTLLLVQIVTGILLALNYAPTPDHAWDSVDHISSMVSFGGFIRGLHHWSASVLVVVLALHVMRVFFWGAYKFPRELTWVIGVCLGLLVMAFAFTGYLLPWDQKAYWGTEVGTRIAGSVPLLGDALRQIMLGGPEMGAATLTRFYGVHTQLFPLLLVALMGLHLFLVRYQGITEHWRLKGEDPHNPFWPTQTARDVTFAALVFGVTAVLAIKLGAPLDNRADPTATNYVPRPEWYFLFLFELLRHFEGSLEPLGTVVIPVLCVMVLFLVPFLDRGPGRGPFQRKWVSAIGVLVVLGLIYLTISGALFSGPVAGAVSKH